MLIHVPLSAIVDNPFQKRRDYGDVGDLAERIRAKCQTHMDTLGLLQVPMGRLMADDGYPVPLDNLEGPAEVLDLIRTGAQVQLAFGHRRVRAFRKLQETDRIWYGEGLMPVTIVDLSDEQMLDAVWSENHERRDVSAVEEAELLAEKLDRPADDGSRRSQREVAEAWGLARSTVANRLRLLDAPEAIQEANRSGRLSERQALAVMSLHQLAEAVNGSTTWTDVDPEAPLNGRNWGLPPAPAQVFAYLTTEEAARDISSDDIRGYIRRAANHAGRQLATGIAAFEFDDEGEPLIRQARCAGCPQRVHERCMDWRCLQEKTTIFGIATAKTAAAELDLPYSPEQRDFWDFRDTDRARSLDKLWQQGGCEHLVVGWLDERYGVRPFHQNSTEHDHVWYAYGGDVYQHGSRDGVVLGHAGPIGRACWPEGTEEQTIEEAEPDPLEENRVRWAELAEQQAEGINKATRQTLVAAIAEGIGGPAPLAIWKRLKSGFVTEQHTTEELARQLVESIYDNGSFFGWSNRPAVLRFPRAWMLLEECGFDPSATLGPWDSGKHAAIRVLAYWCRERGNQWRVSSAAERIAEAAADAHNQLAELIASAPAGEPAMPELAFLAQCLETAIGEIGAALPTADEEE